MHPDLTDLTARYLEGDPEALRRVDGWIRGSASEFRRRLEWQWDDLLQAARFEITRLLRAGAFQGHASLSHYVARVVCHMCIDRIRAQKRIEPVDLDEAARDLPAPGDSPLDLVLRRESAEILQRVLEATAPECRHLWRLILSGASYAEMSRVLGSSEGALRVKVMRCRKKAVALREAFAHDKAGSAESGSGG